MPYQATTQGAKPLPPIPNMEQAPPPGRAQAGVAPQAPTPPEDPRTAARNAARQAVQDAIRGMQGQPGIPTIGQPPRNLRNEIPPEVIQLSSMLFVTIAVIALGVPIVRALARRFDRKTENLKVGGADMEHQLRQLQDSVDSMAIEIERISESQRFTAKLMAERAPAVPQLQEKGRA